MAKECGKIKNPFWKICDFSSIFHRQLTRISRMIFFVYNNDNLFPQYSFICKLLQTSQRMNMLIWNGNKLYKNFHQLQIKLSKIFKFDEVAFKCREQQIDPGSDSCFHLKPSNQVEAVYILLLFVKI